MHIAITVMNKELAYEKETIDMLLERYSRAVTYLDNRDISWDDVVMLKNLYTSNGWAVMTEEYPIMGEYGLFVLGEKW